MDRPASPAWLSRFATREDRFVHGDHAWSLVLPKSSEDLFDQAAFDTDERLPYWADLWPSATCLARAILDRRVPESDPSAIIAIDAIDAIELGSGVALVSLAMRAVGASIVATDYEPDALRFAAWNAEANGLGPLATRVLDWRTPPADLRAPLVIAADVLYEKRNADAIAELLPKIVAPGGRAIFADPRRPWRAHLMERLAAVGWVATERPLGIEPGPTGKATPIVLLECRAEARSGDRLADRARP